MRSLWNVLAFIAVVNLLAIILGGTWMWWSGRMDESRLRTTHELFLLPVAEVERLQSELLAEEQVKTMEAQELRKWGSIPVTSIPAIEEGDRRRDLERMMRFRLEREAGALEDRISTMHALRESELDQRERDLKSLQKKIEDRVNALHDEDFQVMVQSVSELDDGDAIEILQTYIAQGREDLVVTLVGSLEQDRRTELLAEFVKENQADLAGRLLLSLRERGLEAVHDAETMNATTSLDGSDNLASGIERGDSP